MIQTKQQKADYDRAYRASHRSQLNASARAYQARTAKKKRLDRKVLLLELAGGARCCKCGYDKSLVALDFDHRDPTTKIKGLLESMASVSWERLVEEVAKCQVLCANCHRIKTFGEGR